MTDAKRIDLHVHSFLSDGVLLPSELLRRVVVKGYRAIAITDHADASNMEELITSLMRFARQQEGDFPLTFIPGVELTHVAPRSIAPLARRAKELGAGLVLVHGETISEPVRPGTNRAAVECPAVDILAHPGFITLEEARLAAENDIYLEITSHKGHCLTNGHVANIARQTGARLVVNTDTHTPQDMIDQEMARRVAAGAGLNETEVEAATVTNPQTLVQRAMGKG
ncbi:MAG: histidinol phosphate phosphatase domain-containing protein [Anaerolineae bacterium]|nr:histidinol phosphate phosphatase domain-containing protein [Anaerolineae bacterium]